LGVIETSKELLGRDLKLVDDLFDVTLGSDLVISPSGDLETVSEEYNLGQAIINRLRTRQGELADLGHALYGSHLYELVGEPNNERTRELAKLYARESIAQDPRVKEIVSITIDAPKGDPNRININMSILPMGRTTVLNIVFPFYLEVA
jgi:phage baseplate assembly protein W